MPAHQAAFEPKDHDPEALRAWAGASPIATDLASKSNPWRQAIIRSTDRASDGDTAGAGQEDGSGEVRHHRHDR